MMGPLTVPPHQTRTVTGCFHGTPQSFTTLLVTVLSGDYPCLMGYPAITDIVKNGRCSVVITNARPTDIFLKKGDIIRQIEYLPLGMSPL